MNNKSLHNFSKLTPSWLLFPLALVIGLVAFLMINNTLSINQYIDIQKDAFYSLNQWLGQFRSLQVNLTQLGDALVILSILSVLFLYAPAIWGALINASLVSLIISPLLKRMFAVPRPAAFFDNHTIVIVGKVLTGHNSLPSGHSITVFTLLTVIFIAFLPKNTLNKVGWGLMFLFISFFIALSRVGVGAHYPLDVVAGAIVGIFCGMLGIIIQQKLPLWNWIGNRKFYPIFIVLFAICIAILVGKIMRNNLLVFYVATVCLIVSLVNTIYAYAKK